MENLVSKPASEVGGFGNKLTKLGRCDRYTIEGIIIGLLGLLGL